MVEFETVGAKEIKFKNKFIEVARKRAKTPEGETEIISISKGFYNQAGEKRFKNGVGSPADKEIIDGLINALESV